MNSTNRGGKPGKYKIHFGIQEYYKYYIKNFSFNPFASKFADPAKLIVSREVYNKILRDTFLMISEKVLDSNSIKLPNKLGTLVIQKRKMNFNYLKTNNNLYMDYQEYKRSGLKTFFTNDHTDGYYYKVTWFRDKLRFPALKFYKFIPNRKVKRTLAKYLKTRERDYIEYSKALSIKIKNNDNPKANIQ